MRGVTRRIELACARDLGAIHELMVRSGLPTEGLAKHLAHTLVVRDACRIVGSAALEVYAGGALLRSVAVDQSVRGRGLGQRLVEAAIDRARQLEVPALYLLTTTAEAFFPRFGFEPVSRAQVPDDVQRSVEFVSACPASAVVMRLALA
jgi:amino-acid N-acetyltransferase